ncbi:GntR family transcriptional regulator [Brachybacterium subflavum]|uniref:GntR family transcriptional regulator n=1 Tax=Brachybacterium subflavum TaxID=2585206 RepID=UPI001D0CEA6D|nr:GntR family transcriptional regulator [Brachybacterium subflavum]
MTMRAADGRPKHEWLASRLRENIAASAPRAALPPERDLASTYGVSRATVRTALRNLELAGLVHRVQGAGTFVAPSTVSKSLALTSFSEDMRARGSVPGSRVITADEAGADAHLAESLGIAPGDPVARLVRLRLADGEPMCLETTHIPVSKAPGLLDGDLSQPLYEHLDALGAGPMHARQVVRAVALEDAQAALLSVPVGSPALAVTRVAFDRRDAAVERTTSVYRADRYDISFGVRRALVPRGAQEQSGPTSPSE